MSFFRRRMVLVESLSNEKIDHFDCENCSWEGIDVPKGNTESAGLAFNAHSCDDYSREYKK
jgi:hypothetical protein